VLVVTEVDKVPPLLYPLLRKDLSWSGPRKVVAVGDKQVDWSEGFRLFLLTRNPRPSLPPDVAPLLTIANFTTTRGGLEGEGGGGPGCHGPFW
jgi:dynein heavy chain 2